MTPASSTTAAARSEAGSPDASAPRIILLGATGYTGRLILTSLIERGQRPLLAGRSAQRLRALVAEHLPETGAPLPHAVVDAARPGAIRELLSPGDVLISTVGPFARHGGPAVQAAAEAGAHYLDTTGEVGFVQDVAERWDEAARRSGAVMVPAFGYDYVPGMLTGALAADAADERLRTLRIAYFMTGSGRAGLSSGTRMTMADSLGQDVPVLRDGRIAMVPGVSRARRFTVDGERRTAVLFTGTEVLFLPELRPDLRDLEVYLGWFGGLSRPLVGMSLAARSLAASRGGRRLLDLLAGAMRPRGSGGPDAAQRARTGSLATAEARDGSGRLLARAVTTGPNTYTLTGHLLAEGAMALRDGAGRSAGVLGPVQAFGVEGLRELTERAGMTTSLQTGPGGL